MKVKIQDLQPGDRVLLKNLRVPGKCKLADRWRPQPYVVCKQLPGLPVYQIRPDGEKGHLKMWHRNHLLPISDVVRVPQVPLKPPSKPSSPRTRSQKEILTTVDEEDEEFGELWGRFR